MAQNWRDVRAAAVDGGSLDEGRVARERERLTREVQAHRLADLRKSHALNQKSIAERMRVSQARVSKIEHGVLARTEVGTLDSYVEALGGRLRIVAEFDDQTIPLR